MTGYDSTSTLDQPAAGAEEKRPLAEAGEQAAESAGHLAERAAGIGLQQADRGREMAATGLEKVAETVRRVSLDMQTDQPQIADAASTAADQAEKVAQYLRETDARQMIGKVEDVARRQPLLFVGGAFLLGIAASRFIKAAGGGQGSQAAYRSDYRSGRRAAGSYQATLPGTGTTKAEETLDRTEDKLASPR